MTEKNKKTHSGKKEINWKRIRKVSLRVSAIAISVLLVIGIFFGVNFVLGIVNNLEFDQSKLYSNEPSPIYDQNGEVVYTLGSMNDGTRENITYDDLPQVLVDAVVATEDSRFFEHNGFDLPRIVKAALGNIVSGGITSGGSTITQQLIKKSFYEDGKTNKWQRKVGEIFLAMDAEKVVTKEDILVLYLNKIAYGRGMSTLGIQSGARYYFDKDVQNLTLPEAALLAGTLNAPDSFDPYYNLEKATKRRNVVLDLMYRHGYISEEEMISAKSIPVENTLKKNSTSSSNQYQNYIDLVLNEELPKYLKDETLLKAYPSLKGLNVQETPVEIHTFLNTSLQDYADSIASGENFKFANEYIDVGASIQETTTGKIVGIIGGRSYYDNDTNNINQSYERHQPGSSLKPIIAYASAFEFLDWSTGHPTEDKPWVDPATGHSVKNWNNQVTNSEMLLEVALTNSFNLPAMHTMDDVIAKVSREGMIKYLEGFGFTMSDEAFSSIYAIGGWEHGPSPIQTAGAYATLSNNGKYIEPHAIDYIVIKETGEKIDIHNYLTPTQAISEESAFMITEVMRSYTKSTYSAMSIPYNVAAKSGTSDWGDNGTQYGIPNGASKDSWLAAYTEDYSVAVCVGYNSEGIKKGYYPKNDVTKYAQRICAMLLKQAHGGTTKRSYTTPSGVTQAQMIKGILPYSKPTADTPAENIITAWFKNNNMPTDSNIISGLNALSSFEVQATENQISVKFGTYDSSGEDQKVTEIYGKPVYVVEIRDSSGKVLHTQTSESPTFNVNYKLSESVQVVGYYSRDKSPSIKSNEMTYNITIDNKESYTIQYYQDSLNGKLLGSLKVEGKIDDEIDLSKIDVNKYKPENYDNGVVDTSKSATKIVKGDNDIVYVVYTKKQSSSSQDDQTTQN